jgi:aminopeptidase-like protein
MQAPPNQSGLPNAEDMMAMAKRLFPICRSLTGNGVRDTLRVLAEYLPIHIREVPTGTQMFDWTAPQEWNIRDAYIKDSAGNRVVDFHQSNLHVMGYSIPVRRKMSLAELRPHLFSLPAQPDLVPFRTSYFRRDWAFSLSHRQLEAMQDAEYEVCIDSSLEDGFLTYGEALLPGEIEDEILITTHVCHPSLANDNVSGMVLAALLGKSLAARHRRHTYRFLFVPAQLGSIAWLAANEHRTALIKHGIVLVAVGDSGTPTYKRSRQGNATVDRAMAHLLGHAGAHEILEFWPHGNDERQFCSPGFNLPVGAFMRTPCGRFPEYHTSADNLGFIRPECLADSMTRCMDLFDLLDGDATYLNLNPKCEPQLGRRGLYRLTGDATGGGKVKELPILWTLNLSDGSHTLLDIAERSGYSFGEIRAAASALEQCGLLEELTQSVKR